MLLITPPAAGTKASTHFTQHSFSFPFYFSTNKNIVIWNKQLGVSLISIFSLRWLGRAFFCTALLAPALWLGKGWPESHPAPHTRCWTLGLWQFVSPTCPCHRSSPCQLCAPILQPPKSLPTSSFAENYPCPLYPFCWASEPFYPALKVIAVPLLGAQIPDLLTFPHMELVNSSRPIATA